MSASFHQQISRPGKTQKAGTTYPESDQALLLYSTKEPAEERWTGDYGASLQKDTGVISWQWTSMTSSREEQR